LREDDGENGGNQHRKTHPPIHNQGKEQFQGVVHVFSRRVGRLLHGQLGFSVIWMMGTEFMTWVILL